MAGLDRLLLTVNVGSSSLRLALFRRGRQLHRIAAIRLERMQSTELSLAEFLDRHAIGAVTIVAHRIVHGGSKFCAPRFIDAATEAEIARLKSLAPLHNPVAMEWVHICRKYLGPGIPQVAVFDTAFFANMPKVATDYALPRGLCERYGIRRYGFHGLAHEAMLVEWRAQTRIAAMDARVISMQLGAGCSMAAISGGQPVDSSMGFSPLEGLMMSTRSGDIDPGIPAYLQREAGLTAGEIDHMLSHDSGLLGVSGLSANMQDLLASERREAKIAVELFCYRVRKYLGAYLAVLGGTDAILIGGGIGEHAAFIRERILTGFEWAGIRLDRLRNMNAVSGTAVHMSDSGVEIWILPADEEQLLSEAAVRVVETVTGEGETGLI